MTQREELPISVRALEWEYVARPTMTYTAYWSDGDVAYYIDQSFGSDSFYFRTIRWPEETIYDGDDLLSAQAAAQADFESRILSALVASPKREEAAVDSRPANCRHRLQDEGKPYPRSSCHACGRTILTGLGNKCAAATPPIPPAEAHESGIVAAIEKFQDQTGGFGEDDDDQVIRLVIASYLAALSAKEGPTYG